MTLSSFPTIRPTLLLDFANAGRLDPRITFTRASTATFFNSLGVLSTAASGAARFDYNPTTLAAQGLLIEEQRTNLLLQSGWAGATSGTPGAAPTSWTVGFGTNTVTTVLTSSFDPTANAVKFDCDSGERVMFQQAINVTNGVQYALSAYLEAVSGSIGDGLLVTAGTATLTQNTFVTNPSTPGRYTILFTATGTGTVTVRVGVGTSASVGATVSATWSHPQVEVGAFATSYIPTTTTALTRNADVASMTGTNFSSWYNASEGTLYAECSFSGISTTANKIVNFDNGAGFADSIDVYAPSVTPRFDVYVSSAAQAALTPAPGTQVPLNTNVKISGAYATNNFAVSRNGGAVSTDSLGNVPTVSRACIGNSNLNAQFLNGTIRSIRYYPVRLANAQLQALTA